MDILSGWDNFIRFGQIHFDLIKDKKKIYSINESKDYDPEIRFLLQQYKKNHYNMRWVGTLVADAHRILINDGIFYYPNSEKNPNGKIRILYESIPLAFIFKNAGGVCLNGSFNNMLERISNYNLNYPHLKTSIVLASKTEYENMRSLLNLYEENEVANTIKIINNYIDKIKVNYDLNDDNLYKIMYRNNIDENILDLENILNLNSLIFDNQILIESSDMLNYIKMMTIYLNKIKTYIKYPSNWIGSSNAIWN